MAKQSRARARKRKQVGQREVERDRGKAKQVRQTGKAFEQQQTHPMETNNYQGHKKTQEQRLKESTKFNFQTMNKTKLCD